MEEKNTVLDILKAVYNETDAGLKYAEAKNAALVGFNIALLGVVSNLGNNNSEEGKIALQFFIAFLVISMLLALLSFWPYIVKIPLIMVVSEKITGAHNNTDYPDNLLFYGHLSKKRPCKYIQELYFRYRKKKVGEWQIGKLEIDYAREIINNSRLALRKYILFRIAFIIDIIGIVRFFCVYIKHIPAA